jgi:hypothetical protein
MTLADNRRVPLSEIDVSSRKKTLSERHPVRRPVTGCRQELLDREQALLWPQNGLRGLQGTTALNAVIIHEEPSALVRSLCEVVGWFVLILSLSTSMRVTDSLTCDSGRLGRGVGVACRMQNMELSTKPEAM